MSQRSHGSSHRGPQIPDTADDEYNNKDPAFNVSQGLPAEVRRLWRRQKVRLWLSSFQKAEQAFNRLQAAKTAASAARRFFEDSGTYSADSCYESPVRVHLGSTERKNPRPTNPRSRESMSGNFSSRSAPTSLNKLLSNKLKLLACSTPSKHGEHYSVRSQTAAVRSVYSQSVHNTASVRRRHELLQEGDKRDSGASGNVERETQQEETVAATPKLKRLTYFTSWKSVHLEKRMIFRSMEKPDAADSINGGSKGGSSDGGSSSSSSSEKSQRKPASYHVRILPAMCYLVWRPNQLRRECLMDRGQAAYLNALHPSSLPMERLMHAVATRLDIEVPVLAAGRADFDPERSPKFDYMFRWHTPNGRPVDTTDRIVDIEHPKGQTGEPQSPVRIFLAGSPGWLPKDKRE